MHDIVTGNWDKIFADVTAGGAWGLWGVIWRWADHYYGKESIPCVFKALPLSLQKPFKLGLLKNLKPSHL